VQENGQVAQLVEQRTENPCVGGSIPSLATIDFASRCPAVLNQRQTITSGQTREKSRIEFPVVWFAQNREI
jgi:hypothetical protein